jgi:hypothetical protein
MLTIVERVSKSCKNNMARERKHEDHLDMMRLWEMRHVHYWTKQQLQTSNKKHGRHTKAPNVDASGNRTSDRASFVVVLGQDVVLAIVNQHARSVIRNEVNKLKLVFLLRFHSIFFLINLVNATILRYVVWHYFVYCEKILNDTKAQLPI